MQKSAHPEQPQNKGREHKLEPSQDKGLKYEPFYIPPLGSGRRGIDWARRLDKKR